MFVSSISERPVKLVQFWKQKSKAERVLFTSTKPNTLIQHFRIGENVRRWFCHFYCCCDLNNSAPSLLVCTPQPCACTTFSFHPTFPSPHVVAITEAGNITWYHHSFHFGILLVAQGSCNPRCHGRPPLPFTANHWFPVKWARIPLSHPWKWKVVWPAHRQGEISGKQNFQLCTWFREQTLSCAPVWVTKPTVWGTILTDHMGFEILLSLCLNI